LLKAAVAFGAAYLDGEAQGKTRYATAPSIQSTLKRFDVVTCLTLGIAASASKMDEPACARREKRGKHAAWDETNRAWRQSKRLARQSAPRLLDRAWAECV